MTSRETNPYPPGIHTPKDVLKALRMQARGDGRERTIALLFDGHFDGKAVAGRTVPVHPMHALAGRLSRHGNQLLALACLSSKRALAERKAGARVPDGLGRAFQKFQARRA